MYVKSADAIRSKYECKDSISDAEMQKEVHCLPCDWVLAGDPEALPCTDRRQWQLEELFLGVCRRTTPEAVREAKARHLFLSVGRVLALGDAPDGLLQAGYWEGLVRVLFILVILLPQLQIPADV